MAEDLTIKIQSELKELGSKAQGANLTASQAQSVEKGLSAAQKAFDARD